MEISLSVTDRGKRWLTVSWLSLIGIPAGIVFLTIWATVVKTSPTLDDDERVRGWGTVIRELPATLFLFVVVVIGIVASIQAGRRGLVAEATRVLKVHTVTLLLVLLIVLNGSTENIMTTRPSTVKWLLFPIQLLTAALVFVIARRLLRARTRG